ncbi:butyrophilin-like protein 10 [Leuresthes tenuis]|uniref:butyrophilin-like protein 10 n=1 Tax=Leuresthes tenuis TaxID=355514 RepID=UPI003B504F38
MEVKAEQEKQMNQLREQLGDVEMEKNKTELQCRPGRSQGVPAQLVTAMVGDDAVLPCRLKAPADVAQLTVEWGKPALKPRFVYVWYNNQEHLTDQNTAYKGRASMSIDQMKQGDVSLKLSDLRYSDNGRYRCFSANYRKQHFVELLVGVVASPGISLAGLDEGVVLQCESAGWYPEPEVFWLDGEGNLLSAGPTETLRGSDGLYNVSSRVTVEKGGSYTFTCRVQQKNTNQSRETRVHVPVKKKLLNYENEIKELKDAKQKYLAEKQPKLEEELKRSEQNLSSMTLMTEELTNIKEELEKQSEQLADQRKELQKEAEETGVKIRAVDEERARGLR